MNKTGITIPPISAPTLPPNHIYKVKLRYNVGSPYWKVKIRKQFRFGFFYVVTSETSSSLTWERYGPEKALRETCEQAYDAMMKEKQLCETTIPEMKTWEGKWEA